MGYFDSAKNRTAWQKELTALRAERARRAETGFAPGASKKFSENPHVKIIDFNELENRVFEAERRKAAERARDLAQKRAKAPSMEAHAPAAEHTRQVRSSAS